jgi:outer membrane usher protein FimD/PapC
MNLITQWNNRKKNSKISFSWRNNRKENRKISFSWRNNRKENKLRKEFDLRFFCNLEYIFI